MKRLPWFAVAMFLTYPVVQAQQQDAAPGALLLAPFKQELQQALRAGLAEGPVNAIEVCQLKAPDIADTRSRDGIHMGRSSHRLRNPANAGPDWVDAVLQVYLGDPSDRTPRTIYLENDRVGYVEPIVLQPLCLTCHGDNLAPEVAARIRDLYPDDRATGFQVGDLRGVFWVDFPRTD